MTEELAAKGLYLYLYLHSVSKGQASGGGRCQLSVRVSSSLSLGTAPACPQTMVYSRLSGTGPMLESESASLSSEVASVIITVAAE